MPQYKYLIVGGGMTADSATQGIRELDPKSSIGVISTDSDPPYDRPPLTKGLWKGKGLDTVWRQTCTRNVQTHLGRTVQSLDPARKTVTDDQKQIYNYEKLLLATGGTPRTLPVGGDDVIYFRSLADYRRLRGLTEKGRTFAVIGGGFIGSELAAALAMNDRKVVMLFSGAAICHRAFPADLAGFLNDYYRGKGVEILPDDSAASIEKRGAQFSVKTKSGREYTVDGIVAGLGITPNIDLAKNAGLKVDNGIIVDEQLRTSQPDIFAAGDVAVFHNPALDKLMRVEHEDNANTMGQMAGKNMAGASDRYTHLPFFYSDLFDLGYEAVGELDSRLNVVADWKEKFREGVLYYEGGGRVRGVLLWNVWSKVDAARELIASKKPVNPANLQSAIAWRT